MGTLRKGVWGGINVVKVMEAVILKNLNLNCCYVRIKK